MQFEWDLKSDKIMACWGFLLCCMLFGCVKIPQINKAQSNSILVPRDIKTFKLQGKVAYSSSNEHFQASLSWKQISPKHFSLSLSGPLGMQAIHIDSTNQGAMVRQGHSVWRAKDAEKLLARATNYQFPIYNLYYWLRGLQTSKATSLADKITTDGWHISYLSMQSFQGVRLPQRILLEYDNQVRIKIFIRQWRF